jgi:hypothetical protein
MARREREILEHAVHAIAEQAVKADELGVQGISMGDSGDWGHRFPAPHGEPVV